MKLSYTSETLSPRDVLRHVTSNTTYIHHTSQSNPSSNTCISQQGMIRYTYMKPRVVLLVLDGWGIGERNASNPIHVVQPKNIEFIKKNFPSGSLQASGLAVGLPWREEGNSEVGHLTMGIGRVVYQHFPRISLSIQDGTFQKNEAIQGAIQHALQNKSTLHLAGLISDGNVHSSLAHIHELIALAQKAGVTWKLHAFTDGRDTDPTSAWKLLQTLPLQHLASISGRFYAMDRDKHWDFTQRVYKAMTGEGSIISSKDIQQHIEKTYAKNLNDEFVAPALIDSKENAIHDNDSLFFFNFREDRMRQLAELFVLPSSEHAPTNSYNNLYIASMTQIREDFTIPVAFPPQHIDTSLGKILSDNQKMQLRIAETQKYAHVTFFFNGLTDKPFKNEYRILIPSKTTPRQEEDPNMQTPAITQRLIQSIEEGLFDFTLVNFASPDMIAHTGNYNASKEAVAIVDEYIGKILDVVLKHNVTLIITADHGNIERLFDPLTGEPETKHDPNPVPIYLIHSSLKKPRQEAYIKERERYTIGMLSDIAPTILDILSIPKPPHITGQSLLKQLL